MRNENYQSTNLTIYPTNILVTALFNLGDLILMTSALDLIKKNFPATKITLLVDAFLKDAVENNSVVDEVIAYEYKNGGISFSATRNLVREIKRRNFDLAISFDRKSRTAILLFMSGIKRRVVPSKVLDDKKSRATIFYTDIVEITHDLEKTLQAETYQEIVRKFFNIEGHGEPQFPKTNSPVAEKLLSQLSADKLKIALCVKGTFPLKTYPKEYFAEVVKSLREKYSAEFFIVGAPSDKSYADEVISEIGSGVLNFCGETSVTDLAEIFRRSDLFITVDTGATHIAATTKIKMVVMYGCTSPDRWKPINKNAIVLTSRENCCPCKVKVEDCPSYPKSNCLYNVTPQEVIDAADIQLGVRS